MNWMVAPGGLWRARLEHDRFERDGTSKRVHFARAQVTPASPTQAVQVETSVADPFQGLDAVTDGVDHAPDLTVSPFVELQTNPLA